MPALSVRRNLPPTLRIGAAIVALHLLLAALGPFLAPYPPSELATGIPMSGATLAHPFGVDQLGRDVFSRVLHGAPIVLILSIAGTSLGILAGGFIGLFSAYVGGLVDNIIQRLVEALISIPFIMLALLAIAAAGPELSGSPVLIALVIAIVYIPRVARMARAAGIEIVGRDYVLAARLQGESTTSVILRDLVPNATGVLLVEFALRAGYAPVLVGALGFLGFGLRPPTPEWGLMIAENRELIFLAPVTVVGPGLALASLVVGLNLFTDGIARIVGRTSEAGLR